MKVAKREEFRHELDRREGDEALLLSGRERALGLHESSLDGRLMGIRDLWVYPN